jgi:predicted acetyltransferase
MTPELRWLTLGDDAAHSALMNEAFSRGRRPAALEFTGALPLDKPRSPKLGFFEAGRLVAAATYHPLHLRWDGGAEIALSGVAGVACAADCRGRGYVARLLAEGLRDARERAHPLSGLFPFSYAFYRKHGWDWVGEQRSYTIALAMIPSYPEGRDTRRYEGMEAVDVVRPIYDAYTQRYRGMATRTDLDPNYWKGLDHRDGYTTYTYVYRNPATSTDEGYLVFRYPAEGDTATLHEFFVLTPSAYRGLLSMLHYYGTQLAKVSWNAPFDDPLSLYIQGYDLQTRLIPLFMGRIVSIDHALSALKPAVDFSGRIVIGVTDGQAEWNNGVFAVIVEAGQVSVTRTDAAPEITLDIATLSQAYWGQPSLDRLRTAGRMEVRDESAYQLLAALLPPATCFLKDGF